MTSTQMIIAFAGIMLLLLVGAAISIHATWPGERKPRRMLPGEAKSARAFAQSAHATADQLIAQAQSLQDALEAGGADCMADFNGLLEQALYKRQQGHERADLTSTELDAADYINSGWLFEDATKAAKAAITTGNNLASRQRIARPIPQEWPRLRLVTT